jgi:hypothetical protein
VADRVRLSPTASATDTADTSTRAAVGARVGPSPLQAPARRSPADDKRVMARRGVTTLNERSKMGRKVSLTVDDVRPVSNGRKAVFPARSAQADKRDTLRWCRPDARPSAPPFPRSRPRQVSATRRVA